MIVEQNFSDRSNYPKVSVTATPIDAVEWFAENVGITNLDDPSMKIRTVIDDVNESELARHEARKAREAAAQDAFLDAMFNLDNGTAVLRQTSAKNEVLKKSKAIKSAKPKIARKIAKVSTDNKVPVSHQLAKARRSCLVAELNAGKMVKMIGQSKKNNEYKAYQMQLGDLTHLRDNMKMDIVRLSRIQTGESFFVIDNLTRHKPVEVTGNLVGPDREPLVSALSSGELFEASNITKGKKAGSASVAQLAKRHGMNLYAVIRSRTLIGWVMIEDDATKDTPPVESNQESDINDLGDMLDAMDYLRIKKEVAVRMPTSTPDEILEAAYREFKRVAKDAGSTISEVLAAKESQ